MGGYRLISKLLWPAAIFSLSCSLEAAEPLANVIGTNSLTGTNSASATVSEVEKDYAKLQSLDDAAQAEVEKWKHENQELKAKGAGTSDRELKDRIQKRLELVRKAYEDFLGKHPDHAQAHLTYGSFLNELEDESGARGEWEKALQLDPKLAAAYNNLAGVYTEGGEVKKAFDYFNKALELSPAEGAFYHNFADSAYVLRKGAMKEFDLSEQQVYAKALSLYSNAVRLEPTNFLFASDFAQTFYALNPIPFEQALKAWTNASKIASDESKRQLALVHLARLKMLQGHFGAARAQLAFVTHPDCAVLKSNLLLRIAEREQAGAATNSAPRRSP